MKRCLPYFVLPLAFAIFASCGKKGPLQPPLLRIPQGVTDFSLTQRGDRFILSWTNPTAYIDGHPLGEVAEVEIWLMVDELKNDRPGKVTLREFEKDATLIKRLPRDKFLFFRESNKENAQLSFVFEPEKKTSNRKKYTFGLRVRDERRRTSAYSELLSLEKQVLPLPPRDVRAVVFEDHVRLTWEMPLQNTDSSTPLRLAGYHIYRAEDQSPFRRITSSPIQEKEHRDKDISFERIYRYLIRAVAPSEGPLLESDDSEIIWVKVLDTFPPAPPLGLSAVAGAGLVALSWQAIAEGDLAGYRIWRKEAGHEEFKLVASVSFEENTYLDSAVEKSKAYDYAITALDRTGNESRRSEIASVVVRQELR